MNLTCLCADKAPNPSPLFLDLVNQMLPGKLQQILTLHCGLPDGQRETQHRQLHAPSHDYCDRSVASAARIRSCYRARSPAGGISVSTFSDGGQPLVGGFVFQAPPSHRERSSSSCVSVGSLQPRVSSRVCPGAAMDAAG